MKRNLLVVALLLSPCMASLARADPSGDVGLFVGYHWFNDDNQLGRLDPAPKQAPIDDSFIVGLRAALRFHPMASIEGELGYLPASTVDTNVSAKTLAYRLQLLVHPRRFASERLEPFGVLGIGGTTVFSGDTTKLFDDSDFVWHFGVGARWFLRSDLGLRVDLRFPVAPAVTDTATIDAELLFSVFKTFGGGHKTAAGPGDRDGDGIADSADGAIDDPEDKDGFQDDDGIPDPDNDSDGIPDAQDHCPLEAETKNGIDDTDGCPDTVPEQLKAFTGVIKGVEFETDSDKLRATSNPVLDKAVQVLKQFPAIKLEIAGYTDSQGAADHNRDLSQRRAEAVKTYLVQRGIDAGRLDAVGYGADHPIADNATPNGRQQNRRVEFHAK